MKPIRKAFKMEETVRKKMLNKASFFIKSIYKHNILCYNNTVR